MGRRLAGRVSWMVVVLLLLGLTFGVQADATVEVYTPPLEMKPESYDVSPIPFDF
ncbi:hypothetical protein [Desmospora activa]|uniref:Uncharacterized protein n=1 Tax=Desmospora activa DSM 45169 TaxID=1121389 RepID=A0A2T4Z1Y1_9BACL|nr:hypothetical protein [Desmospora activa]PTM54758.1 hypothetical protein C8J48_3410 [Desmospora activa DSM 45169]